MNDTTNDTTMVDLISQEAIDFIIEEEDGSETYYEKCEEHFDWPGGMSGATIGVGYDLGYVTDAECVADWKGILSDDALTMALSPVGLQGNDAHNWVRANRTMIDVPWELAIKQFTERELPKWYARCTVVLPNYEELPPLCRGMLLSLAYNRGTGGFTSGLPRFIEMANIWGYMKTRRFDKISDQIRNMRRLWPTGGDLWKRRMSEAALFDKGMRTPWTSASSTSTSGSGSSSTSPPSLPPAPSPSPT